MQKLIDQIVAEVGKALTGKEAQVRLALCCLLCRGHLLLEDLPGMGKTTLARALAKVLGLDTQRIQFTSDLLPADILGVSILDAQSQSFRFHAGPIFTELVLADEINRATPKTQSALLEAMEEQQVSVEGETRPLPAPFFVIATQNPVSQSGTYPLPESQLDRFFMRQALGYPDPQAERQILLGVCGRECLDALKPIVSRTQLQAIQKAVADIRVSDNLLDYLQRLIAYTRNAERFAYGLSSRAALALLQASKAWALMSGRQYVIPEDLQAVLPAVVEHRLQGALGESLRPGEAVCQLLLSSVDVVES